MSASPHGTDGHGPETEVPQRPVALADVSAPPRRRIRDLISRRSRLIAVLLSVSLFYVVIDIFVHGPLTALDVKLHDWDGQRAIPSLDHAAWAYDKVGQRSVLVPILLLVAGVFARRHHTWRPVVLAAMSFLVLNLVVGAMKILIGRSETETGSPDVLNGGIIFPSGHSSNMVLTGGVIIYLFLRYAENPPLRRIGALWSVMTTLTCLTSLYIGSHWLTDLIGGALVGGLLLQSVILFDVATADVRQTRPWWWRRMLALLPFLETDRDGVDAIAVAGGRLRGVIEDVTEVGAAPAAPDLRPTHAE
jgi:membrane-associated phospholipid phosphatase